MEGIIGEIKLVCHSFDMSNYIECTGKTLSIEQYTPLYALIGIQFGGDSVTTFNLPTLTAPLPNLRYVICVNGLFPTRD